MRAPEITARGVVSERVRLRAQDRLVELESLVKGPILGARAVLTQEANPRVPMHARAEAEVDLQGHIVRARAAAPSMEAAVDAVTDRLARQLRRHVERLITRQREPAEARPGERRHRAGNPPPAPVPVRGVQEREIIRRKTFAFSPMSIEEAAGALEDLDHDFFLFRDAATGADAVIYWREDGLLAVIEAGPAADEDGAVREPSRLSSPIDVPQAVEEMNALGHRFLFFENAATGRGNVIYLRYDGHYGLIGPA